MAASSRTVVVLPLVPVTSSTGMSRTLFQSTSSGSGRARTGQVQRPLAEAHRGGAVVRQERDPAGRRGIPQGEEAGIRLAGDLVPQPRRAQSGRSGACRPASSASTASQAQSLISVAV